MHTIVVPLDGSELAAQVMPHVRTLAPLLDAHVHLLRVVPATPPGDSESWAQVLISVYGAPESEAARRDHHNDVMEELHQQAQAYLDTQAQMLRSAGIEVTSEVRTGSPAETIVEVAAAHMPGALIAMATHGYSGLRRWALGSVADKVIHATDAPVLLVRGQAQPVVQPPHRILTPLDGSGLVAAGAAACERNSARSACRTYPASRCCAHDRGVHRRAGAGASTRREQRNPERPL